jgi:Protein of unknown function DUF262
MMNPYQINTISLPRKDWVTSMLEQYRIADFLEWSKEKRLELNPKFQRGDVWSPASKTFLIDTILRKLPIPKVYLRTRVDVVTQKSIREVVDGQQRLRAIINFANNGFALSKRAEEFVGKKYGTLTTLQQEEFLAYPISVDSLLNASDNDVLEIFARLNSYTVTLTPAEKRHGKFQGDFKWAIRSASKNWSSLWTDFDILSTKDRTRMLDDSLTAEMVSILMEGVTDGGQPKIDTLYKNNDNINPVNAIKDLNIVLDVLSKRFAPGLKGSVLLSPPHLLMFFSALAYVLVGIPVGELLPNEIPPRLPLISDDQAIENLLNLAVIISSEEEAAAPFTEFWRASKSSTQRIASRRIRFGTFVKALTT